MIWVPGTDCPAQQHVGYPVSVLAGGTDTGATPLSDNDAVTWAQIRDAAGISVDHVARRWGTGGVRGDHQLATVRADRAPRPDTGPTR